MEIILNPNPDMITANTRPFRSLLELSRQSIFEPSRFYRYELSQLRLSQALAFGISNAWGAAVLSFFVQTFNTLLTSQLLDRWMQRLLSSEDGFSVWGLSATTFLYSSGALLLAPFFFLIRAYLTSIWLYVFARVLIEDRPGAIEPVTFNNTLRIQAASLTGHWFSVVPIFGGMLSFFVSLVLTATGVRERFGVSTRRAYAVVLAPYVMMLFLLIFLVVVLIFGATQLPLEQLLEIEPGQLGF